VGWLTVYGFDHNSLVVDDRATQTKGMGVFRHISLAVSPLTPVHLFRNLGARRPPDFGPRRTSWVRVLLLPGDRNFPPGALQPRLGARSANEQGYSNSSYNAALTGWFPMNCRHSHAILPALGDARSAFPHVVPGRSSEFCNGHPLPSNHMHQFPPITPALVS